MRAPHTRSLSPSLAIPGASVQGASRQAYGLRACGWGPSCSQEGTPLQLALLPGKETWRGRERGSWEPERERLKGQQGSVSPSSSANSPALDKISQHSVSLRIVREQSQTFRSTSQAPELRVLFSLFHTPQTSALKDTGAFASDLPSNLSCQRPGKIGRAHV